MATYWGTSEGDFLDPDSMSVGWEIIGSTMPPEDYVYDTLYGLDGHDWLNGGLGSDYMDGGNGDDSYVVNSGGDTIFEAYDDALSGRDIVYATVSYILPSMIEDLDLSAGFGARGTGNAKDNWILGSSLANVLDGKAGADSMEGREGGDTYYVDNVGDRVNEWEEDGSGADKVFSTVTFTLSPLVENLTLQGSANINANGNALNNTLVGNSGRNILTGALGADTLDGAGGDDFFDFNSLDASNGTTRDRIVNFQFGTSTTGDRIDVTWFDANSAVAGNQAFKWGATTTKSNGYLWAENSTNGDTIIKGNIDADTEAEFQVAVADGTRLANAWIAADFIL